MGETDRQTSSTAGNRAQEMLCVVGSHKAEAQGPPLGCWGHRVRGRRSSRPARVYLTPFLLREAGGLYMGVSPVTDVQPCYKNGTFLFLEMRS